jgi:hypothetical protein
MADAAVEQVTEKVADRLEDAAEATRSFTLQDARNGIPLVLGGALIGFSFGYWYGFNRAGKKAVDEIDKKYAAQLDLAIEDIKKKYAAEKAEALRYYREKETNAPVQSPIVKPSPEEVVEAQGYSRIPEEKDVGEGSAAEVSPRDSERTKQEVFERAHPEIEPWDYQAEYVKRREIDGPFVVHVDEYRDNEKEHDQTTWTYYEDDDVLATERDEVVEQAKWGQVIGQENLRFGHGSNDINVVYIRNNALALDIEVVRNPGNYAEIVHGLERNDLKHSEERGRRHKPRFDDDN